LQSVQIVAAGATFGPGALGCTMPRPAVIQLISPGRIAIAVQGCRGA